jgi:hypothetical protein
MADLTTSSIVDAFLAGGAPPARVVAASYGATVTPNADTTDVLKIGALTGNVTIANPSGTPTDRQELSIWVEQDGTGGRTVTLGSQFRIPATGVSPLPWSTTASQKDLLVAQWNSTDSKWEIIRFIAGYGGTPAGTAPGDMLKSVYDPNDDGIISVAQGGTGTDSPAIVAGTNVTVSGTWPNQTINASVSGTAGDMLSVLSSAEISVTTTATLTIGRMHVCSGTSADYTVTLPAVSGNAGKFVGVRMAPGLTKFVTVDGASAETIDGAASRLMWAQESAILMCDGSTWTKVAGRSRAMLCTMARSANVSVTANTNTKIDIDTTLVDNTALMADTTNKRIYARRTGNYRLYPTARINVGADSPRMNVWADLNGGTNYNSLGEASALNGAYATVSRSEVKALTAGDYMEISVFTDVSSTAQGDGTTANTAFTMEEQNPW